MQILEFLILTLIVACSILIGLDLLFNQPKNFSSVDAIFGWVSSSEVSLKQIIQGTFTIGLISGYLGSLHLILKIES